MREQGIVVNDVPLQQLPLEARTSDQHSILDTDSQLHIPMSLQGTMSGFTVRAPTREECTDPTLGAIIVHMTSSMEWNPKSTVHSEVESELRAALDRGTDLHLHGSRQIQPLQLRGQEAPAAVDREGNALSDFDLSSPLTSKDMERTQSALASLPLNDVQGTDPGLTARGSAGRGSRGVDESVGGSNGEGKSLLSLKALQQHAGAAIDVASYADLLMAELGVTEKGMQDLGHRLAATTTTKERAGFVGAEQLARNWKIGLEAAKRTVESTTQLGVRDFSSATGSRRLKPFHWYADYNRLHCPVYTDTYFGQCKSLRGNTCAQVYSTDFEWVMAKPMKRKVDAHETLLDLFKNVGVPSLMIPDNAKELTEGEFRKKCRRVHCPIHPIEPYTPNQNRAEGTIREVIRHYSRTMADTGAPEVLWDYCLEWCAQIRSHTALNICGLDGKTPATKVHGDTADISHLAEFGWYDWVWYVDKKGKPALDGTGEKSILRKRLGRYLGPSDNVGSVMCGVVMDERANRLDRTSIIPLSIEDKNSEPVKRMKSVFSRVLADKLKDRIAGIKAGKPPEEIDEQEEAEARRILEEETPEFEPYEQWSPSELGWDVPNGHDEEKSPMPELDEADDINYDGYIGARVMLPRDGHTFAVGRVLKRARDQEGQLIGKRDNNPLLDSSQWQVEFEDGSVERYHANIIAENIYSRLDADGTTISILEEILDHKKDDTALSRPEGRAYRKGGSSKPKKTTRGWKFLIRLKDQSTNWVKLKNLKEANPVELAEYAQAHGLMEEPAFAWWAPWTIRKRDRILKALKTRYQRTQQKFGIELPKTVKRALEIDAETGTTFWRDALKREMGTVMKAFDILDEGAAEPKQGRQFLPCHIVFDIKQGTLQRKARYVASGCCLDTTGVPTYASVVSRESVRIAFTLAALNGLDILAADCEGAYLNAPPGENVYTKCGPEFGEYEGRWAIIVRALYGLGSSAHSWRKAISSVIESLGYRMCRADNDVWMRPGVNAAGEEVWEYVLVYSDDLLVIGLDPKTTVDQIDQVYKLKDGSVKEPDQYLGADVGKMDLANGTTAWYMSSDSYCKAALDNMEAWLEKKGERLPTKTACVFPSNWKPELDVTPELRDDDASFYQQQIGVLRWLVELGRVDICTEVSMLAAFSANPRQGHLAAVIHLYAYLKKHPKRKMVFDPTWIEHEGHKECDWSTFYPDYKELEPHDMPEPRGKAIQMTCWVDSDHAGDAVSRRSRTGVFIFCGMAPIVFYSKKQGSIESSSFGSELSAMKTAVELVEGLRYKLRMMGVPLEGRCHIKADNMSVIHNCSSPTSQLKKKSNSIAFHYVRERCAGPKPVCAISYVNTQENLADMLTKSQPGPVRERLAERVLY